MTHRRGFFAAIGIAPWLAGRAEARQRKAEALAIEINVDVQPAIEAMQQFEEAVKSAIRAVQQLSELADKFKAEHPELAYAGTVQNPAVIARDALARAGYDLDEPSFVEAARELDRELGRKIHP